MIIVTYIFIVACVIQVAYYISLFGPFAFLKDDKEDIAVNEPVSIIICARNEAENLENNLPFILEQDYLHYEVVVVDDHSTDNTTIVLERLKHLYPQLRVIKLEGEKTHAGKKDALQKGITAARNELLVLTDADCRSESPKWITLMAGNFSHPTTKIVLGYGAYESGPGLLNAFIRYDTFLTALQYFSLALSGKPYMGVGRNLAYKRSFFLEKNNFKKHASLPGGDDDLFINAVATKHNTDICFAGGSATISLPKPGFGQWIKQKWRHSNAGHKYKLKHRLILGIFLLSMVLSSVPLPFLILKSDEIFFLLTFFAFKIVCQLIVYEGAMNKLGVSKLWPWSPLLDFCMSCFLIILGFLSLFKTKEWKK